MADLVSWLTSQLDYDEQVARAATAGPWAIGSANRSIVGPEGPLPRLAGHVVCSVGAYDRGVPSAADAEHIVLHDPAGVLRQVAAHRRILDAYVETEERRDHWAGVDRFVERGRVELAAFDYAVRALASIYSDRPGFNPDWALA